MLLSFWLFLNLHLLRPPRHRVPSRAEHRISCELICIFSMLIPRCLTCVSFLCSEQLLLSLVYIQTDSSPREHPFLSNQILTLCYGKQYLHALMVLCIIRLPVQHCRNNSDRDIPSSRLWRKTRALSVNTCGWERICLSRQCHRLSPLHPLPCPKNLQIILIS